MDETASTEAMSELLLGIVRAIVDSPDETDIYAVGVDGATCFRLSMAKDDLGKVIGKQGRTARSIRTVLGASSMKFGRRVTVEFVEAEAD